IDEHTAYGIYPKICFVKTGSPRTFSVLRGKNQHSISKNARRIRVLYAPTDMSVYSSIGTNVVWDKYFRIVRGVFEILDRSELECTVKLLSTLKIDDLDLSNYRRLRFQRTGLFTDIMWDFDYLLVDSLGGSPLYESLVTDKPILLYAGIENLEWDRQYIEKLK